MESAVSEKRRSGPIFILGAVESGTALVRTLLDRHPHIAVPQDTGFARALLAQQHIPFWLSGDRWWGRLGYSDETFTAHLRDFYDSMFRHFAEQHGKRRWGDATPFNVWHVSRLAEVFPDAAFVGVVRHAGGNVDALQQQSKYSLGRAMNHWLETNRELLALAEEHPQRMVLCRYEDLVLHTEPTLRELLAWLGEPWADTAGDEAVDPADVSQWAERRERKVAQVLRNRSLSIGSILGYDVHDPVPPGRVGGGGATLLMTGAEAAARTAQIRPANLELRVRPEPRPADRPLDPREVGVSTELGRKARRKASKTSNDQPADAAGQDPPRSPKPGPLRRRLRRAIKRRSD